MFFDQWENIIHGINQRSIVDDRAVATGNLRAWNHDVGAMEMILRAIRILKPKVVIETGTFEALGTEKMAREMGGYDGPSSLHTYDFGMLENTKEWEGVADAKRRRLSQDYGHVKVVYHEGRASEMLKETLPDIGVWDFCFQDSVHLAHFIMEEWNELVKFAKVGSVAVFDDMPKGQEWIDYMGGRYPEFTGNVGWEVKYSTICGGQLWAEKVS